MRNEIRSSIGLFRDEAVKKIDQTKLNEYSKVYLRYKIADQFTGADADVSAILRTEQGQSIIDVYETVVDVFQRLIKADRVGHHKDIILRAMVSWSEIEDVRLHKLSMALGKPVEHCIYASCGGAASAFARGDFRAAYIAARKHQLLSPSDVWAGVERVFAAGLLERESPHFGKSPWTNLGRLISIVLRLTDQFTEALGDIEKFCRNFRGLLSVAALSDLIAFISASETNPQSTLGTASLNTSSWGPEDLIISSDDARDALLVSAQRRFGEETANFWLATCEGPWRPEANDAALYLRALRTALHEPARALRALSTIEWRSLPREFRGLVSNLRIALALRETERNLVH